MEQLRGQITYFARVQGVDHILTHQSKGTEKKQPDDNCSTDTSMIPSENSNTRLMHITTCVLHIV